MANRILNQLYARLFDESFSYSEFSKRLKMQKGIYLLQEMGVPVGEYRFTWYKHGPYSQSLLDDMHDSPECTSVTLTPDTEAAISELHEALVMPKGSKYTQEEWAECLGSLHYLKDNVFSSTIDDNTMLNELLKRKDHLTDDVANREALARVEGLFS